MLFKFLYHSNAYRTVYINRRFYVLHSRLFSKSRSAIEKEYAQVSGLVFFIELQQKISNKEKDGLAYCFAVWENLIWIICFINIWKLYRIHDSYISRKILHLLFCIILLNSCLLSNFWQNSILQNYYYISKANNCHYWCEFW